MDSKCMKDEVPDILTPWTDKIDFRLYDSLSLDEQNCSKLQAQHVDKPVTKDLMNECSNCYRTFSTSDEMALHYEKIHSESRRVSYYYCFACPRVFLNRNVRDQHIITHFSALMNTVMYNIDNSQLNVQANLSSNQCPICLYVVSTRKSFRQHLLFQHVLKDMKALKALLGSQQPSSTELQLIRRLIAQPNLFWKRKCK